MKIALCAPTATILTALAGGAYPVTFNDGIKGPLHLFESEMTSNQAMDRLQAYLPQFFFGNRLFIEHDASKLQPLPYIVVRDHAGRILGYNRPDKNSEVRLAGKFSIGFGGHIEPDDCESDTNLLRVYFADNARRELCEELIVTGKDSFESLIGPVGLIHDLSDDVGIHHLGVVYIVTVDDPDLLEEPGTNFPEEVIDLRWLSVEECAAQPKAENWTAFLIEKLLPILGQYPL